MPLEDACRTYLGLDHGHQVVSLHREVIAELRALARRLHDPRWRVIGLDLRTRPSGSSRKVPTLDEFVAERELDGWTEAEQLEMYTEAYPSTVARNSENRKRARNNRMRERQMAVLADLEERAITPAALTDPVDAWFDPQTAERLVVAGLCMLGEIRQAIARGGQWWRGMPSVGPAKAEHIARFVERLVGTEPPPVTQDARQVLASDAAQAGLQGLEGFGNANNLDGSKGSNRAKADPKIKAKNDLQAVEAWIASKGQSPLTAAAYRREAQRWVFWCIRERGKAMSSAGPEDCVAYMQFLNRIPTHWQSARKAVRLQEGWTPFRGQLKLASRRYAVKVLNIMCSWLETKARWLESNPWDAVNLGLVDGQELPELRTSRALTHAAYDALLAHLPDPAHPGTTRNGFILVFGRHTGLRPSELLSTTAGAFTRNEAGWVVKVVGKGRKPAEVTVPSPAVAALRQYLASRGFHELETCPPATPLLGPIDCEQTGGVSYSAVHQSFKAFVQRAISASTLSLPERERALKASQHWLRHTYATRAVEAGVPEDVLMEEMRHADRNTTAGYYKAPMERRQSIIEKAAHFAPTRPAAPTEPRE